MPTYLVEFEPQRAPVVRTPVSNSEHTVIVDRIVLLALVSDVRSAIVSERNGVGTHQSITQAVHVAKRHAKLAMGWKTEGVDARQRDGRASQRFELSQELEHNALRPEWSGSPLEDGLPQLATDGVWRGIHRWRESGKDGRLEHRR